MYRSNIAANKTSAIISMAQLRVPCGSALMVLRQSFSKRRRTDVAKWNRLNQRKQNQHYERKQSGIPGEIPIALNRNVNQKQRGQQEDQTLEQRSPPGFDTAVRYRGQDEQSRAAQKK